MSLPKQPTAIIVGAARASTTSLFYALGRHPQIYALKEKEPNWYLFSGPLKSACDAIIPSMRDDVMERSKKEAKSYEALFAEYAGQPVILEASPVYLHSPGVEENIRANNPAAKIIVIRRDAVELFVSMFTSLLQRDIAEIGNFLTLDTERADRDALLRFIDLDQHIQRYRAVFPEQNVLVIEFSRLVDDEAAVLAQIMQFLALQADPNVTLPKFNASGTYKSGALASGVQMLERNKNLLKSLLPNKVKGAIWPMLHRMRSSVRQNNEALSAPVREMIEAAIEQRRAAFADREETLIRA